MALESPMAEQKLIELAEAAASLTDAKTRVCLSDGDNACASSSTITINSASLPVSLAEEANVLWTTTTPAHNSSSFNFCPVGYVTKARPHYVTRLYDVAFSYPESSYSYPYYPPQPLAQTFADPGLTQFVQPPDLVAPALTEEDPGVKDVTELELEVLDLTPTSLTALKALDLLSDVSSRVVVSAPPMPEPAASLCSTAAAAGMDCVSSNLSVVTLRVPDSSLPVSHALGATAQSECECSLHDVKMKLEVKGGQGGSSSSSLVELQPAAGYPASEVVTTFVSESLQPVPVITSDVRSAHQRHYQQQMSFRGWPGTVTTRVESSSQKYVSYLPQPAVPKQPRPVRYFTTPPQPAPPPTSAPARTTATLQNVSVLMPKRTPAPSTAYLPTSQSPLSHPLTRPERASYSKATPGIRKAPDVKVVSQPKRKEKAVYNAFPSLPPLVYMGDGRQATTNTFSAQPELKLHPDAAKEKEAAIPALSPDSEAEPVPHFDPLSIVVEEVSSQPLETAEKESPDQFRETGNGQPNGQCTFCCESYLPCPSSSGSDVCLAATCTQSDGKGLKRKMKTEEGRQESAGTRDAAVVAPRRSKRNSTIRCNYCPRLFANTSNVARHVRIFHPASYRPRRRRLTQSEAAARTKPAELAGRKRFKPSGVSVGIQCTLVSNGYDVAAPRAQESEKTQTKSREFPEEFWKESGAEDLHQEAFRSDSGHGVVTSSFSAEQDGLQQVQQRDPPQARSATKVSQETDVSSSLIAGIVALMKEKRSKTTKRRGRPAAAALAPAHDVTKRHTTSRRLVTSSSDKLTLGSAAACSWNFPSSSSQSTLNFRTKPRTRINSTIPCPYCPRFFSVMSNLKRHTRMQHSDVFVFNCNVCLHKFSMRRTLKKHMQNHADDHPFQCDHCLMRFRFGDQLHVHAKRHDIDKFPCHDCSLTFYTLAHLHQHLRLHH